MYPTRNDLPEAMRARVVDILNARLADAADVFTEISRGADTWLWFVEVHATAER